MPRSAARQGLERDSLEPLYRQLAARLRQAIDTGRFAPGARLPSEPELMAEHGLSRVTVRQAIALLQTEGKVATQRGKGTFVLGPVVRHDLDALQGFHDALVGAGVQPETELLEFTTDPDDAASAQPDLPVRLLRRYSLGGRPFALVTGWLPAEAGALDRRRAERMTVYPILADFLGLRVARAEVVIRCQRAPGPVARSLGLERGARQVLVMERTSFTASGRTCEFMRIHIVPDRFEFRLGVQGPLALASAVHPVDAASGRLTRGATR